MANTCACCHETDEAVTVLVCRPHGAAIQYANEHLEECLFREPVCLERLLEQHDNLVAVMRDHGVTVRYIAVNKSVPPQSLKSMSNIIFTRDSVLTTRKGVVIGRFREPVRLQETHIPRANPCYGRIIGDIDAPGCVEGGDFFPAGEELCFIAVGNRTNMDGVMQLIEHDMLGTDRVAIVQYPEDGHMCMMHLDCYFGIVRKDLALLWEGARHLQVVEYCIDHVAGSYVRNDQKCGARFDNYLRHCGYDVIIVSTESQRQYGCNVLALNDKVVLCQDIEVTKAINATTLPAVTAIFVEFDEVHKMYGGIRCATQVVSRRPLDTT